MIDAKAIAIQLNEARTARIEAEDACCDLEELIWQVQHVPLNSPRVAYVFDGFGRELADWAN
jgi:hypothetical protein